MEENSKSEFVDVDIELNNIESFFPRTEEDECIRKYENWTSGILGKFCNAAWDSFHCWPPTPPGDNVSRLCADMFPDLKDHPNQGIAFRQCNEVGEWSHGNWTNYSECIAMYEGRPVGLFSPTAMSYIILVGSIISLICLVISLFIFSYFKSLQCSRIRVHRNLVISLILHSVMMFIISLSGISNSMAETYKSSDWVCKSILIIKTYAGMTCIYWMFVEGHLLHNSITVSVFKSEAPFHIYYAVGWGIPLIFVCTWVTVMEIYFNSHCWEGFGKSHFIWLITAPMITAVMINTIFLINIIRILVTKLRSSQSLETKQVRKAIKATALLFPLLGITHLLFLINPRDSSHFEHAYLLTNAILQSSQGLFVALLYCFLNSEVQSVLKHSYVRASMRRNPNRSFATRSKMLGSVTNTTSLYYSTEHVNGSVAINSKKQPKGSHAPLKPIPPEKQDETPNLETLLLEKETSFIN